MRYFLLFCLTVCMLACSPAPVEETIIGRWNYDHIDFKATANNDKIDDYTRESIAENAIKLKSMYYEFYADKSYDYYYDKESYDMSKHGSYTIEGDGKYISLTAKTEYGSEENERLEIVRLTGDSLTMISAKGAYVVYAKVK